MRYCAMCFSQIEKKSRKEGQDKMMEKKNADIIVVGAGAAGLMAARQLARAGKNVIVLEARDRTGGRIFTQNDPFFAELGAEFIHGDMPYTLQMLRYYGIEYYDAAGELWQLKKGKFRMMEDLVEDYRGLLEERLGELKEDISISEFLNSNFSAEQFSSLRESVLRFTEGYESAEPGKASTFNFRNDLAELGEWKQYRVEGGYSALMEAMAGEIREKGGRIVLNAEVKAIHWRKHHAEAHCSDGKIYNAAKIIITVPLSLLQSESLRISPFLPAHVHAAQQLGFGRVIKLVMLFKEAFWIRKFPQLENMAFLFSDAKIPTWWTQFPDTTPLLTGWLSGEAAAKKMNADEENILEDAFDSLSHIFGEQPAAIREKLISARAMNWGQEKFTRGSYVYATVGSKRHMENLAKSVEGTLYFAGDACSAGSGTGIVEAALESAMHVTNEILGNWLR